MMIFYHVKILVYKDKVDHTCVSENFLFARMKRPRNNKNYLLYRVVQIIVLYTPWEIAKYVIKIVCYLCSLSRLTEFFF